MNVFIDTTPLRDGNAGRGVGQYTRMLIDSLKTHTSVKLVTTHHEADIVHYPFFDLFFLTLPLLKTKPTIVTIHDVIPLLYPSEYPKGIRGTIKHFIQLFSLTNVKKVVTDSDSSSKDVIQLLKQPKSKVTTVYLAPDPTFKPTKPVNLELPYFMYTGDINYNKNVSDLFRQFAALPNSYLLVLVCKTLRRDNPAATHLWSVIDTLGIEKRLRIFTDVSADQLRALYSGALWYVQPSLYEGFGLPVLEAQACGCPVISTKGGSLDEICGESCFEFDLLRAMDADRTKYINFGFENMKRFDWKKTATQMARIYSQCA